MPEDHFRSHRLVPLLAAFPLDEARDRGPAAIGRRPEQSRNCRATRAEQAHRGCTPSIDLRQAWRVNANCRSPEGSRARDRSSEKLGELADAVPDLSAAR